MKAKIITKKTIEKILSITCDIPDDRNEEVWGKDTTLGTIDELIDKVYKELKISNENEIKKCFSNVIWMAIRYADGRSTYAPSMVRESIKSFKNIFPDWKLKKDIIIQKPENLKPFELISDHLFDLFEDDKDIIDESKIFNSKGK